MTDTTAGIQSVHVKRTGGLLPTPRQTNVDLHSLNEEDRCVLQQQVAKLLNVSTSEPATLRDAYRYDVLVTFDDGSIETRMFMDPNAPTALLELLERS